MKDTIVKKEYYFGVSGRVELLTVETVDFTGLNSRFFRYFAIIKNGIPEYTSPEFYGGSIDDTIRNCDSALQVVRFLLTGTGFLLERVVD